MKRALIAVALALSACTPTTVTTAPAPLNQTVIDEKGLIAAVNTAQAIRTVVDFLRDSGKLVPGTPLALQVQEGLRALRDGLNGAAAARQAGSTTSYAVAIAKASEAAVTLNQLFTQLR